MSQVPPPPTGYAGSQLPPQPRRTNGAAIASLIFGVLGCIPILGPLLAIVFGFVGVRKARDPNVGGKGLAIAGIILGVLWLGIYGMFGGAIVSLVRGTAAERETAKLFVTNLAAGNADAAVAQTDGSIPREQIDALVTTVQGWGALSDVTCASFNYASGRCEVGGVATFGGTTKPFEIILVESGEDQWKVIGVNFK
jgi:hypothetical protein